MICVDPNKRITALQAIQDVWIQKAEELAQQLSHEEQAKLDQEIVQNLKKYRGESTLKKAAMNVLVKHLSNDDIKGLQNEFKKMDKDYSGFLELNELVQVIHKSDIKMSKEEIQKIVKEVDYAENGLVNYSEFIAATINAKKFLNDSKLLAIFQSFDIDNTGSISYQNLKDAFSKFGRDITDQEIEQIMQAHDLDKDKQIDLNEFKLMMCGENGSVLPM
jgi:calcium-dependent protein kinase